jgi:hypothetical protein
VNLTASAFPRSGLAASFNSGRIVIRDDDISFFTDPERFERAHAFLIRNRIPFNVAVIPEADDAALHAPGVPEGFLPPGQPGRGETVPIGANAALVKAIRGLGFIEVSQHGWSHAGPAAGEPEFLLPDRNEAIRRLDKGLGILEAAFGKKPAFFVPPRDRVSRAALDEIRRRYAGVCMSRFPHGLIPARLWPRFILGKRTGRMLMRWGRFLLLQHPGADFSAPDESAGASIEKLLRSVRDVLVLPVHSWRFFDSNGRVVKSLLDPWEELLKRLSGERNIRFTTFSGL